MIKFENVTKTYKDKTILKNISLEIEKGKLVAFIGASGCGKTTTLKMINRLIKPSTGRIYINGEDIEKKDVIKLRRNMGYVIQQTGLLPHMTVKENIELIPRTEKYDANSIIETTAKLMDMVGLDPDEYLNRYPVELSGGQQQRVGVARAFATDPDIILMDEPFSALDPITRTGLQDELVNLQSQLKKTIVFVTHDMDEAVKIADMICIMKDGEILQYDTPENILKNPKNEFVSEFVGKNRIWASPEYIKAEDIMIDSPVTCSVNMTLLRCVEKMRSYKVDSLMVVENKTNKLLGIVNAKQLQRQSDRTQEVGQIMNTDILGVRLDDDIVHILKVVDDNNVSNIPVLSDENILLGLITKSSLVTTLSQPYLEEEEVLV
ncbi:osmoprotectant transport system ATP-binding protein [Anaerosporobacter mobilis DSM 15930]|uniref:Quaternary amine transport ATP-binding protein n=1 Tax=Anaerosporobacter mobilis DSM 15930 TaxID=1120996 RepID=A0A1M7IBU1_9FIRM|nr:ABC transporter ATP-binding protein [Anaerosporobacter mobilis]SHM38170.1 osmoprotectant transport system ATP-binding protein [Anaerosporobacter mobilis DSM 15930]